MTYVNTTDQSRSTTMLTGGATTLLALTLVLGACSPEPDPGSTPTDRTRKTTMTQTPGKNGTGEVRSDLDPLTSRFSALGTPAAATWLSGTVGDPGVPGPTTYWINAVVELDPALAQSLVNETTPTETTESPAVVEALVPSLPDGPLLTDPTLDARFTESGFVTKAYLDLDNATLVLVSLGE